MNEDQIKIIKAIQNGLPLSREPFREIAEKAGIPEEQLLAQIKAWLEDGTIRRFGAILRHHKAGFMVNAMGVWNVPDEQVENFGTTAASSPSVSHCYQRPRFGEFVYNIYTMIHGKSHEDCERTALLISEQTGISDYELLYTTEEYKKSSPVYFSDIPEHGQE